MIKLVSRDELNEDKYNTCIDVSEQSLIYAYSWYLDIVCDQWSVLVLNDYDAVMPVSWRKKYTIKYVYHPLWVLQLGMFSKEGNCYEENFINELRKHFKFIEIRLNKDNGKDKRTLLSTINQFQYLDLQLGYEFVYKGFNRNRKRELKKAENAFLRVKWNDNPKSLLALFKNNVGKRIPEISNTDYSNLLNLMHFCIEKKMGEVLSIYNQNDQLVASGFFLFHKNRVTELVCSTDFNDRNNGANTYLIDRALFKYQKQYDVFDFGGSSRETIAHYYKSFGANSEMYNLLKINDLPRVVRFLKP